MRTRWLFIWLAILFSSHVAAASDYETTHEFHFQHLRTEGGLSKPRVNCIHQDRTGYMWFGTADGLNRFDGHEVLVFRPEDRDSRAPYIVTSIHEDPEGFFWLGETNTDFSKFDPATATFLEHHRYEPGVPEALPYSTHVTIRGAPGGTLWIGTGWIGLLRFDPRSGKFMQFPHREPTGESTARDGVYPIYSSEPDSEIVWLGTESSGLIRLDAKTGALHRFRDDPPGTHAVTPPSSVIFIGEESPGILWVGSDNGQLYRFDAKAGRFLSAHRFDDGVDMAPPGPGLIMGAVRDPEGRIWVASQNAGLAEFRPGEGFFNRYRHDVLDPRSLSNNLLTDVYRDRSGVVWVATKRDGVSFFDPRGSWIRHHNLRDENGRYSNPTFVQCFYQEDGNPDIVWLGSGAGLTKWNRKLNHFEYYRHPAGDDLRGGSNAITCFSARRKGGFWIGSQGGLSRYDPVNDRMIRVESPPDVSGGIDDFARGSIRALHEDRHGEVWIGLLPGIRQFPGLLRFNPESGDVHAYRHDPGDPHSIGPGQVTRIHEDRHDRLWFASGMGGKGISRFDRETGRFIRYQHDPADPDSLRDDAVKAFHEDRQQDVLWIGTRSGLDQIAIGPQATLREFKHVGLGTSNDEILGIEQDDSGNLWLASKNGLRLLANRDQPIVDAVVVAPDTAHRFQRINDSYFKLRTGEILIGSQTGFFEVQPDRFHPGEPPLVVLTQVRARGDSRTAPAQKSADAEVLVVSHEQNNVLNIKFAALDFANPRQNRYSYRLEGLEEDWSDVSRTHTATYTTLPAGEYVFRVKAANSRGTWNEEGASLAITILTPWWATWWFRGSAFAALIGTIAGAFHIRERGRRARTRQLEAEAENRETLNRKLTASEERFQSFITNSSEQMWCVEFDDPIPLDLPESEQVERILDHGYYVEANEAFAAVYGTTVEELIGWKLEETFPRSLPSTHSFLLEAVRSGFRMTDAESHEVAKDGSERSILNSFIPTIIDGSVVRVWGTARDVTEMRRVENEIRLRQTAIESSNDGFFIADATAPDFPVVYSSARFQQLMGYKADKMLGRNGQSLLGLSTDQEATEKIRQALTTAEEFQGELLHARKDGTSFWNFLRISPVRDQTGKLTHFVGIATDVTDKKRSEQINRQQRDELAHVSRAATFVEIGAALAHELNQPLAAILRNAQAARRFLNAETTNIEQIQEILGDIIRDDRRAGNVLDRIRQHLSKQVSEHTSIDVNEVVKDALSLVHTELIISHTVVDLDLARELPRALGDAVQLQQVVLNLVLNAEEAMQAAAPDDRKVSISTRVADGVIEVAVGDSGNGIPEENMERIFEPFHTTKESGMGVGLAISKRIVESHHGKMWAENSPAGGARFVFTVPVHDGVNVDAD